jgi:hypothetical protein
MYKIILMSMLAFVSGCATSRLEMTMGKIGCSPNEITITEGEENFATNTWTAECRGKKFYCANVPVLGLVTDVTCTEAVATPR